MSAKTKKSKKPQLNEYDKMWENPMKKPYLEKIILNIGVGAGGEELERAVSVLTQISGKTPVRTISRKNIKEFNLRKGRPIGTKVTLRGADAEKLLKRMIIVNNNKMLRKSFDNYGNFGFGISDHISIPGVDYDQDLGIWGLDVMGRIIRPGMRIKHRRKHPSKVPKHHYVNREEAQYFLEKNYGIKIVKELDLEYI
ncbi:MAG: 50S ribosomal protein L5 [Promethearchaeota archaeon]|nr:MAG: 50S ribosomal protein L5 [Candidatus Lokiarchaeota archaeon]